MHIDNPIGDGCITRCLCLEVSGADLMLSNEWRAAGFVISQYLVCVMVIGDGCRDTGL